MPLIAKKPKKDPSKGPNLIPVKVPEGKKVLNQYTGEMHNEHDIFMMDENQSILLLADGSVFEPTDEEVDAYNQSLIEADPTLAPAPEVKADDKASKPDPKKVN